MRKHAVTHPRQAALKSALRSSAVKPTTHLEKAPKPTNSVNFFSLPPEIRNMIYRLIVRFPKGVVKAKNLSSRLQLFLVNRQFFIEASALFYTENTFTFYSCYVTQGTDPFGSNLHRIQRCLLHLSSTYFTYAAFIKWFCEEFVNAVSPQHQLRYLVVRAISHHLGVLTPLDGLNGIDLVQIDVGLPIFSYWATNLGPHPSMARYKTSYKRYVIDQWPSPANKWGYQQQLERRMMSGGSKQQERVIDDCDEDYVSNPPLSTDLSGQALQNAKASGGWVGNDELYKFLGITREKKIYRG
ncbi:MAG: hypothetical protein Q9201_007979 [Fulgogasparrea decipioides]